MTGFSPPRSDEYTLTVSNPATPQLRSNRPGISQGRDVRLGLVLGGGQHVRENGTFRYDIAAIDLDDGLSFSYVPVNFLAHAIVPDPVRPGLAAVFEKWGTGACEVDLRAGEVTRAITTADDRQFYGHGAYAPDGSLLYSTETVISDDFRGLIAVRDAQTHDYLGEFPSHGASPHDCLLIDDGRTMVITNGGGPRGHQRPCVTWVDVQTQQLLERRRLDTPDFNTGHLALTAGGDLAVVSAPRKGEEKSGTGGISLSTGGSDLRALTEPRAITAGMKGETLSVCIDTERGVVAATTPDAALLTFWDLASGRLLHYYRLRHPRGVTLTCDHSHYVVSYGNPVAHMSLIDCASLEKVEGYDMEWTGITGSHIFPYTLQPHAQLQAG
jgi:hypothetical protein